MDITSALPTFLITLREGVEAALVVGIVLALLNKAKQSQLNKWVYAGVGVGIAASALLGLLFNLVYQVLEAAYPQYTPVIEPTLETIFCVLAVVMLSWMLIWMTKQAKLMKAQVEGSLTNVLEDSHAGWGVFTLILIAVVREGFETVLFIAANFQQGIVSAIGAFAGVAAATTIGLLLFKWGVKINIRQFFQVMGVFLVLIVGGLVIAALKNADEAVANLTSVTSFAENICFYHQLNDVHSCILGPIVWNTSNILPDKKFPGVVLKALFGYREHLFLLQAVGYVVFLVTVGGLYFRSVARPSSSKNQVVSSVK